MVYKPLATTAIGILLVEHRLIEQVIEILKEELELINNETKANPEFIDAVVDFLRTYADKSHHGKEENIFFKDLYKKKLSPEHKEYIDMLVEEHKMGRKTVTRLAAAKQSFIDTESGSLEEITECMKRLIELYPQHITKEDAHFFPIFKEYLNEKEQDNILIEFIKFDNAGVHAQYDNIVKQLQKIK